MRKFAGALLLTVSVIAAPSALAANERSAFVARATWLASVQQDLFQGVQRSFKTRYDGSVWAKACRAGDLSKRLAPNKARLRAWVFNHLLEHKAASKIEPTEKWILVNGVVNMTAAYLQGARGFVKATRGECGIVLKGLRREFGG